MGLFYDLITGRRKKRCTECGCTLYDDTDVEICEACIYEMYEE